PRSLTDADRARLVREMLAEFDRFVADDAVGLSDDGSARGYAYRGGAGGGRRGVGGAPPRAGGRRADRRADGARRGKWRRRVSAPTGAARCTGSTWDPRRAARAAGRSPRSWRCSWGATASACDATAEKGYFLRI